MLVVINNEKFYNWGLGDTVTPLEYAGEVVVTFDPSKTNMAMVIGTPKGEVLKIYEFSGNNRKKGPAMDTTQYCLEVREFLSQLFANVKLYTVAVEQAILKKGVNYYHSSMVLTEIRGNLLNFFVERFGIRVLEINNWSWKAAVLPQGFRSQSEKGSKRYYRTYFPDSPYNFYFEADVTDCLCIYTYVVRNFCSNYTVYCNRVEAPMCKTEYYVYPMSFQLEGIPVMLFNENYTLQQNMDYYTNRMTKPYIIEVDVDWFDELESLYGHSAYFQLSDVMESKVKVVCKRAC